MRLPGDKPGYVGRIPVNYDGYRDCLRLMTVRGGWRSQCSCSGRCLFKFVTRFKHSSTCLLAEEGAKEWL